jgi:predicted phage tail protein
LVNGFQSLTMNGTPIEDAGGNNNFEDFDAIFANGDPAEFPQKVELRLGAGGSPTSVGLTIANASVAAGTGTPGAWLPQSVANLNADFLDLRFVVQQLYVQGESGVSDATAHLEIEMKPSGASTWMNPQLDASPEAYDSSGEYGLTDGTYQYMLSSRFTGLGYYNPVPGETNNGWFRITGKTTSAYVHEIRIAVPNTGAYANKSWDVRVRLRERDNLDADPEFEKRNITWESISAGYNTIFGVTEPWRGLAWLQVYGKASNQLSGVPTLLGEFDTLVVPVPPSGVFNPDTRVYSGATWDGTWAQSYTNDPAWCINGLMQNSLHGLSSIAPNARLNKWDALAASKWFSELVPDGNGGYEPRSSLNVAINEPQKAKEFVQYLAGAVGAICWEGNQGEWHLRVDKPEVPVDVFTLESIVGEFRYTNSDTEQRYNDITAVFRNKEFGYREDRVRVVDNTAIARFGRKPTTVTLVGCTGRQEALRRAIIRLRVANNEVRTVRFTTNRRGRLLERLNTILVADADLNRMVEEEPRSTGRIMAVAPDRTWIEVRDTLRLELGASYTLVYSKTNSEYNPSTATDPAATEWLKPTLTSSIAVTNTSEQRGDVRRIYLATALPATVAVNANVALSAVGLPALPKAYRILDIQESEGELISISAIEIDSGKWAASDAGIAEQDITTSLLDGVVPPPVAPVDGVLSATTVETLAGPRRVVAVNWDRPSYGYITGYRLQARHNGGTWQDLGVQSDSYYEWLAPDAGDYEFRIFTRDFRDRESMPLEAVITLAYAVSLGGLTSTNLSIYQRAAASPPLPSVDATFTFSTGILTGLDNGWTTTTPTSEGNPLWTSSAPASSWTDTDIVAPAEWVAPSILVQDGLNQATIEIFKRSATAPGLPSLTTTYTFDTGALTGLNNGWSASAPTSDGNPLWSSTALASSMGTTVEITAGTWPAAIVLARDGLNRATVDLFRRSASAPALPSASITYTFATAGVTGLTNSWTTAVPAANGQPLWVTRAAAISDQASFVIPTGDWSPTQIMSQDGASGVAGNSSASVYLYQRASATPAAPSGTFTYTFATAVLSGGTLNAWTQAVPAANGDPLFMIVASAVANTLTVSVPAAQFSSPIIQTGAGVSQTPITLYQRAASVPTVPASTLTYTFGNNSLSGALGSWARLVPASDGNPLWATMATAVGTGPSDTIATGEWTTPVIAVQDGVAGAAGVTTSVVKFYRRSAANPSATMPSGTMTLNFSTGVVTGGTLNGWTLVEPSADGNPLWVTQLTASGTGSTTTFNSGTLPTPVLLTGAGVNSAPLFLYQRAATAPAAPVATLTYTFATGVLTGALGSWGLNIPVPTGHPLWVIQATALSTSATDTIPTAEWSAAKILAEDGVDGVDGADALDVTLTKSMIVLPTNGSGAVTSYDLAVTSVRVLLPDGTDVSSNFALSTASNPQTLTVGYVTQTATITSGFDVGEDSASLIILITGSGPYAGYVYRRNVTLSKAIGNTNVSNDRIATAVVAPSIAVGGAIPPPVLNADSTTNIAFSWDWGGTPTDIDGFEIIARASTVAGAYTLGTTVAEEQIFTVPADKRVFVLNGQPSNLYYTFYVRAYRIVDTDINAAGIMRSTAVKSTVAGENPYQPTATPDYTGNVGGTGASAVATVVTNFNARNDRIATPITIPTVAGDGSAVDHTLNSGGVSADISFEWSWGGTEADIDGFEILYVGRSSAAAYIIAGTPAIETAVRIPADRRSFFLMGVSPILYYTFYVRAYRVVDPDIDADEVVYSSWVKSTASGENPYQPAATAAFDGNLSGTISGVAVATVTAATTNFNARNDRNATAVVAPTVVTTGTAVDHTLNTDGSADISFEWVWGGTEADIDLFEIMILGRTSASTYTVGGTPAIEQHYYVPPDRRSFIIQGVAADLYWTFAVRAVRIVDNDVTVSGRLMSGWAQPSAAATGGSENPYRPSATVPFIGDISGTVGYAPLPMQSSYVIPVYRDYDTTIIGGRTKVVKLSRYKANTDVSASATWTVDTSFGGLSGTVSASGLVSLTLNSSNDGFMVVTSTYEDIDIDHLIAVESVFSAPPPEAGKILAMGPGMGTNALTSAAEIDISDVFMGKTGAAGAITIQCYAGMFGETSGQVCNPFVYIYSRPVGGGWTLRGTNNLGNTNTYYEQCTVVKLGSVSAIITGLTANTEYEFKFTAKRNSGAGAGTIFSKLVYMVGS